MGVRYTVDLDALETCADAMVRVQRVLDERLAHLDETVAGLDPTWAGRAADAHRAAHERWAAGARAMHDALDDLARAGRRAHGSYQRAVEANAAMWRAVE